MTNGITNILMVGVGGQGIVLASDILTLAAMYAGFDAKKSEIHGMSQRGGSVFSHIRYGEKVFSPTISFGEADVLFSLEEMETLRWIPYAHKETEIIMVQRRINPTEVKMYPEGIIDELKRLCINILLLDPKELSERIGNVKYMNVALLGVLCTKIDIPEDALKKAIKERVPAGTFDDNWEAFLTGKSFAAQR